MGRILRFLCYLLIGINLIANILVAQGAPQAVGLSSELCLTVNNVTTVVGIFAFVMIIMGAILYVGIGLIASTGSRLSKENLRIWAISMVIGGIAGIIIVIVVVPIAGTIASFNGPIPQPVSCP